MKNQQRILKNINISIFLILASFQLNYAQFITPESGSNTVTPNSTEAYFFDDGALHFMPTWIPIGGTLTNTYYAGGTMYIALVTWGSSPGVASISFLDAQTQQNYTLPIIIANPPINWYPDTDGDTFGDANSTPILSTTQPTDPNNPSIVYVQNNSDYCPYDPHSGNNGCPAGHENMNWVASKEYDINGTLIANSKAYYDALGKNIQSQTEDIKTKKIWASETLYDSQGRAAFNTLSAPINDTGTIAYETNFIKDDSNNSYDNVDFENDPENPSKIGAYPNTLGWYYSENNSSEPYQDITDYPFSRTIYSELNPGAALKTIGGNKIDTNNDGTPDAWLQGFSYTVPAAQELYYVFGKGYFGEQGIIEQEEEIITKFYKTVIIDVHGEESVVFTDGEGKVLALARSGGDKTYEIASVIGEQKYVDIHIPKGITNADIELIGNATDYKIYDLRTEQIISNSNMTGNNIYRVEYIGSETLQNPKTFIYTDGRDFIGIDGKGIRYKVNYYDYTLNYYDKTGNLIKKTQPLGFDANSLDEIHELRDHNLKSTYKYNAVGELLETSSPDEGTVQFMYREDGQIRYSQNSKQAINNEFSYTDYDAYGRPIESGVYNGPKSFGTSIDKDVVLTDVVNMTIEGNRITKKAYDGWSAGTATIEMISGDGYIEGQFPLEGERSMMGLSPSNLNATYTSIAYALYVNVGNVYIYESGTHKTSLGAYDPSDVFKVERIGSTVYYKKNDSTIYTSTVSSTGDLLGDFSLFKPTSKITNVTMGGSVFTPTLDTFTNKINVSISGTTITANAGIDTNWDAGLNTFEVLEGDGYIQWEVLQNDKYLMVGLLSNINVTSASYGYTNYNIYLAGNGNVYVYEKGRYMGYFGTYNANDVFKVTRVGSMVHYIHNGTIFYTSNVPSYGDLLRGDISLRSLNAAIKDLTIVGGSTTQFKDRVQVKTSENTIQKTAGFSWNSGFASSNTITGDGYVSFKSPKNTNTLMLGLSATNANYSYSTIEYALYLHRNQHVYIYESGVSKGNVSTYKPDDEFKVERVGGVVRYYKNDEVVYTSTTTTTAPLLIDASFHDRGTYIEDLGFYKLVNANATVNLGDVLDPNYCKERIHTLYDEPDTIKLHAALNTEGISTSYYQKQQYLSGNVSKTWTEKPSTTTTWYSYDIYGRVEWMVQEIEGLGTKTIDYEYEPITGLVTKVIYQKDKTSERFVHKYTYNIVNELVKVETSTDNSSFTTQAEYEYYETGTLKRTVLGNNVQGVDYVYNLSGQLKAINHPSLHSNNDPGNDANDAFGMHIDYYKGDYTRTNTPKPITTSPQGEDRYDGNIKATRWATKGKDTSPNTQHNAYIYTYNTNKWLEEATYGTTNNTAAITPNAAGDYKVSNLSYDANGNLLSLTRNKYTTGGNNQMDSFTYNYNALTNQLNHVKDAVGFVNVGDLGDQEIGNYVYNDIGQLKSDDNLHYTYTASGLVNSVVYQPEVTIPPAPITSNWSLHLGYNDRGHRISKTRIQPALFGGMIINTTYYVRDASGNVMAIYSLNENTGNGGGEIIFGGGTPTSPTPTLVEHPIYGTSRIGVYNRQGDINNYELTDHLGNVRAVVSNSTTVAGYNDYYPFGMPMPDRNMEGNYRYKFQGQEKDSETGKEAFQLRLWDGRIGRWLTTDPAKQYASPYLGMGNNPINGIDPDGAKNIRFDEAGNYIGITHDYWWHNLLFGNRGQYADGNGGWENFRFASGQVDVDAIIDGDINQLIIVPASKIRGMLEDEGAFSEEARKNPIKFAKENGAGSLDYGGGLGYYYPGPDSNIYLPEGTSVAHNRFNFGNFLTAAAITAAGVKSKLIIQAGAHLQALTQNGQNGYPNQFDSRDDQLSLRLGFNYAVKHRWTPHRELYSFFDKDKRLYVRPFE